MFGEVTEKGRDLRIIRDIAIKDQLRPQFGRKLASSLLEPLAHITQGNFSTLLFASLCNAIRNGAVGENSRDQKTFAC